MVIGCLAPPAMPSLPTKSVDQLLAQSLATPRGCRSDRQERNESNWQTKAKLANHSSIEGEVSGSILKESHVTSCMRVDFG